MMFALSLLYMEILGLAAVRVFCRFFRYRAGFIETFSLSFFAGTMAAVLLLFFYDKAGIAFRLRSVLPAVVVAGGFVVADFLALLFWSEWDKELPSAFRPWTLAEKLMLAGIILQLAWVIFITLPMPVSSHDAVANYALKAKVFWFERGIPEGFFGWGEATVSHTDYPLFLPLVMSWVYLFTGLNDFIVTLIMPVFYLAFIGLIYSQLRKVFQRGYSLLMVFLLATIPQLADYASVIHTDLILAALVSGAFGYLVLYFRSAERNYLVLSSLLLGMSFWVKNEAAVFVFTFALVVSAFLSGRKPSERPGALADMLIAFAVIAAVAWPWLALKSSEGLVNNDLNPAKLTGKRLLENVKQAPLVLDFFQQEVFGPKKWNLFWIALAAAIVWKWKALGKGQMRYMTLFLWVSLACYFAAYMMITGPDNLYFYANTTVSRFMLHFTGIALFIMAFLVKDDVDEATKGHT